MVRVSFGLYNNEHDVDILIKALSNIIKDKETYSKLYNLNNNGDYEHKEFKFSSKDFFSLTEVIDQDIISR